MRFEIDSATTIIHPVEIATPVIEPAATDARQLLDSGIRAAQNGDRADARINLLKCTELDPEIESAWLWLASISEYPEELLDYLDHVLSINPQNQRALEWKAATNSLLSKTFVQRGADAADCKDTELATDHFVKALEYDKRNAVAWMWLATLSESNEGKLLYIEKALSIDPELEDAVTAYTSTLQEIVANKLAQAKSAAVAGRLDEANDILRTIVEDDPSSIEAWKLLAIFSLNIGDKLTAYARLAELDPNDLASAAALESLSELAAHLPVVSAVESRPIERESGGLSMAIAEVVRFDSDAAPEKTPTEELELPPGVEEAFAAAPTNENEFASHHDHAELRMRFEDDPEAVSTDEATAVEWPLIDNIYEAAIIGTQLDDTVENREPGEVSSLSVLEAAYEFATSQASGEANIPFVEFDAATSHEPGESYHSFEAQDSQYSAEIEQAANYTELDMEIPTDADISPGISFDEDRPAPTGEFESESYLPQSFETENSHDETAFTGAIPMPGFDLSFSEEPAINPYATVVVETEKNSTNDSACPFCGSANESVAVSCQTCKAVLTLSDLEMLVSNYSVDRPRMTAAVESLEMERTLREFGEREFTTLGIGHLNLRNLDTGFAYLEQASRLNPRNVILAGQVNILHIRLEEIKAQEEMHSSMTKGKTILVVDDSPTILRLIAGKLEKCGHQVFCSENGEEAMEWLKDMVPDLILLDINMPKMDGYQVCKLIRANAATKDVPVVMISGKDGFFDKVRGHMAGTSGYITKPFGPETLMKIVEGYLQGQPLPAE
jgi:CheY-like chemotaxis protein